METGRVQVYTGDGKGKTTAAVGLAVRAAGAGLRVLIVQFMKGGPSSEHAALACLADRITVRHYGRAGFVHGDPTPDDLRLGREALRDAAGALCEGTHDVVVLDEACVAVHFGLFRAAELVSAIEARAKGVEVVVTGRRAPPELLAIADLITEMRPLRHYYNDGVPARRGIEA
ncbi:MAG: Cob(I)yrinic acid a,c-diamide adenosyltransferase [candidate division BRC1 bacterium ADurb.BinA292]|nr:MAG: Cob(I)yrinic acid a,c-diamide adenosyltransferase [candidate division BRC1 bacterium ADurb.BinA292]